METALLTATGWASGVNAYLTVLILGVAGRAGWTGRVPESLTETWVLVAAGAMFAIEFVVDKIPYLDNAWDLVHTVVRPSVAAAIGAAMAVPDGSLPQPWASVVAAGLALTGHSAKASSRLAINVSPEPLSNIVASLSEDSIVFAMVALAITRPRLAAVLAIVAAVTCVIVAIVMFRLARKGWAAWRRFLHRRRGPVGSPNG